MDSENQENNQSFSKNQNLNVQQEQQIGKQNQGFYINIFENQWVLTDSINVIPYAQLNLILEQQEINISNQKQNISQNSSQQTQSQINQQLEKDTQKVNYTLLQDKIVEKFKQSQQKKTPLYFQSYKKYIENLYEDEEQRKSAKYFLKELQMHSDTAKFLTGVLEENDQLIEKLSLEENLIVLKFQALDCLAYQDFYSAFHFAYKAFKIEGWSKEINSLPCIPQINSMSIILSIFDCYPLYSEKIIQQASKDMFFPGSNLSSLIVSYLEQDLQHGKQMRMVTLKKIIERFKELIQKNTAYASQIIYGFQQNYSNLYQQSETQNSENKDQFSLENSFLSNQIKNNNQFDMLSPIKTNNTTKQNTINKTYIQNSGQQNQKFNYTNNNQVKSIPYRPQTSSSIRKQLYTSPQKRPQSPTIKKVQLKSQKLQRRPGSSGVTRNNITFKQSIIKNIDYAQKLAENQSQQNETLKDPKEIELEIILQKVQQGNKLNKKEHIVFRQLAFEKLNQQALYMFGERTLIQDQNPQAALFTYKTLYSCGDTNALGIIWNLLVFLGQYHEAYPIAKKLKSYLKQAYCLIKNPKGALDLIQENYFVNEDWNKQLLGPYILIKGVFLSEEKRFLSGLVVFQVLSRNKSNNSFSLGLFLLSKIIEKGYFFENNIIKSKQIYKLILKNKKPLYLYDYVNLLFIKKKLQYYKSLNLPKQKKQNQQSLIQENKKQKDNNFLLDNEIQNKIESILEINVQEIRFFLEKELENFQKQSQNQQLSTKLRQHAEFLHKLGCSLLYQNEQNYSVENLQENINNIQNRIDKTCKIIAKYKEVDHHLWLLKMVAKQDQQYMDIDQLEHCKNTSIDPVQIEEMQANATTKNRLLEVKTSKNGDLQFSGILCDDYVVTLEEQDFKIIEGQSTYQDFSNQTLNKQQTNQQQNQDQNQENNDNQENQNKINNQKISEEKQISQSYFVFNDQYIHAEQLNVKIEHTLYYLGNNVASPFMFNFYAKSSSYIFTEPIQMHINDVISIDPLKMVIQLIVLVSSLHIQDLGGLFAIFGWNILFIDHENNIKIPHILALLYSKNYMQDQKNMPPEYFLKENGVNNNRGDIWTLGCILYKLYFGVSIINNQEGQDDSQILQQYFQFKKQETLSQKLEIKPNKNAILQKSEQSINPQIENFILTIIAKCLQFDPYQRESAIEIMLYLHDFLKETIKDNQQGIFSNVWYGKIPLQKRMHSMSKVIFRSDQAKEKEKKNHKKQQEELGQEQESQFEINKDQEPEILLLSGGAVVVYYGQAYVFFNSPNNQLYLLFNPFLKGKQSIKNFTLPEIIQGKGICLFDNYRILQGQFKEFGIPHNVCVLKGYSEKAISMSFNPTTELPLEHCLQEYLKQQIIHHKDPKIQSQLQKEEKIKQQQELNILQQFVQNASKFNNDHQFPAIFGEWVHCDFNEDSLPDMTTNEPVYLNDGRLISIITKNQWVSFNRNNFSFGVVEIDRNNKKLKAKQLEEGQDTQYRLITNEDKNLKGNININQQESLRLVDFLELGQQLTRYKMYIIEGMTFEGTSDPNDKLQGIFYFNSKTSKMLIQGNQNEEEPYFTRIDYMGGDYYEGTIINSMYNGKGIYGNKNNPIFEGYFENDKFISGTTYYYDSVNIKYEGSVIYDDDQKQYLKNGQGKLQMTGGDSYEGEFQVDRFHGKGLLKYKKGKKGFYEGQFENGLREGHGISRDIHGNRFEGQFHLNKKHGKGKEISYNGDTYEGEFFNGKKQGFGMQIFQKGPFISYEGQFNDNQKNGQGILLQKDGKKYQVKFYKDQIIRKVFLGNVQNEAFNQNLLQDYQFNQGYNDEDYPIQDLKRYNLTEQDYASNNNSSLNNNQENQYDSHLQKVQQNDFLQENQLQQQENQQNNIENNEDNNNSNNIKIDTRNYNNYYDYNENDNNDDYYSFV